MRMIRIPLVTLAVLTLGVAEAQAQRFGAQVNWADDADLGIGVRLEAPVRLTSEGLFSRTYVIGSFDYFFPDCDECSYFEFNANLAVPVSPTSSLNPYLGAGLNMGRWSVDVAGESASNTDLGVNLLGGLSFGIGGLSSFAEARFEAGGGEQFVLTFGVLLGGNR